jgi:glycosyltransferase involved in cell wall biosynthesis
MADKKIKVLTISDHPLSPSGVGTQTKYFIVELLKTGKFSFVSLAGAIKHDSYNPTKTEEFGDDWEIHPVDGYGNPDIIRSLIRFHKPDILWFMTDPRFYGWLWQMENEIRSLVPMVYYHVWDNYPYPHFNKIAYDSTDAVVTISKVTSDIVRTVSPNVYEAHIPHSCPPNLFFKTPIDTQKNMRKHLFGDDNPDRFFVFWNSRNARRKQSGSLIWWFNDFLKEIKKENKNATASLVMHTDPKDPNGQDLYALISELGLNNKEVMISTDKISPQDLAVMYSAADVTMGISDAEGFGLSTFESLMCETPIIVTMTGGLQEQVTPITKISKDITLERNATKPGATVYEHGIGIEPRAKAVIGSQPVPYIYEDRISGRDLVEALTTMYNFGPEKRQQLGEAGRKHILTNYNYDNYIKQWEKVMTEVHEINGSWENRKNYKSWELKAV